MSSSSFLTRLLWSLALFAAVSLGVYALCLDYKDDQVHVPFIMRRRPGQP